jgi:WD40 repeat protein
MGDPEKAPKELVAILGDSRLRHWGSVLGTAFTADSKVLISIVSKLGLHFTDVATGRRIHVQNEILQKAAGFSLSADGSTLFVAADRMKLSVWKLDADKLRNSSDPSEGLTLVVADRIAAVHFRASPDGSHYVRRGGTGPGWIEVRRVSDGERVCGSDKGHQVEIRDLAWSPNAKFIASTANDGSVNVYDADTGRVIHQLSRSGNANGRVAFSPDSRLVASCGNGTHVWNVESGELITKLAAGHESLAFSPDGKLIAAGGYHGLTVFETSEWKQVYDFHLHSFGFAKAAAFSPDGKYLANGHIDGLTHVIDLATGEPIHQGESHNGPWESIDLSSDGTRLVTGSTDGTIRIWTTSTGKVEVVGAGGARGVRFSQDGHYVACGSGSNVALFDSATAQRLTMFGPHTNWVSDVAFDKHSNTLVSIDASSTLRTWAVETRVQMALVDSVPTGNYGVYAPTPRTSRQLLVAGDDQFVHGGGAGSSRWTRRIADLSVVAEKSGPSAVQHPSGEIYAVVNGNRVEVMKDLKVLRVFEHEDEYIGSIAFSPDGTTLATTRRASISFWSLNAALGEESLQKTITLHEPWGSIYDICYSPEGRHLFTLNANGTVYVLRLAEGPAVDEATRARFAAPLPPREPDPVYTPAGDFAVEFNGKTTLGTGPYVPLDKSEQFTAEAWVRDWTGLILQSGHDHSISNCIWLLSRRDKGFNLGAGWGTGQDIERHKLWLPHKRTDGWMHLAMVYDSKDQRLYLNGELVGERAAAAPGEVIPSHGLLLGSNLPDIADVPAENRGRGLLSQLRFSNTARYTEAFTPPLRLDSDESTLAAYRFDAGNGAIIRDLSPHARDLLLKDHRWRNQTPPQPPLEELLKDAKWTTLVDGDGKIVAESQVQDHWNPITDANRDRVEITEGTPDGLRVKGENPRVLFPGMEMTRFLVRARIRLVTGGMGIGTMSKSKRLSIGIWWTGRQIGVGTGSANNWVDVAPRHLDEFQLLLRVEGSRMSAYLDGKFVGSYEGELPLGIPDIAVDGEGTFRNVEVLVLPDDE